MLPTATAQDYLWQFQRLLPRGRIWHRGWGTVQAEDLLTLMPTWARLHASANGLIPDAFPCSTVNLLPEWEATLGLPDPCIGELDTLEERQQAVCLKFTARGGQSAEYFIRLAASLGYTITIETFRPFYASEGRVDEPLYDDQWGYVWQVNVIGGANTIIYFRVGDSTVDEPLVAFGNTTLECLLTAAAPAHTQIIFAYL